VAAKQQSTPFQIGITNAPLTPAFIPIGCWVEADPSAGVSRLTLSHPAAQTASNPTIGPRDQPRAGRFLWRREAGPGG
jgi:hypothetical protein